MKGRKEVKTMSDPVLYAHEIRATLDKLRWAVEKPSAYHSCWYSRELLAKAERADEFSSEWTQLVKREALELLKKVADVTRGTEWATKCARRSEELENLLTDIQEYSDAYADVA